ncbi:MAG: HlyD family efflux transporter periplasmic adaptor subunit [Nitrospira sp.]|nr:HlyD family efflux transporter periplasmic adaptor subunit [Nitrospira sp.]
MAGFTPAGPPKERPLPPLRKNLQFLRGAPSPEGVPTWTIVDPVRNKYFQIEWQVYQLLERWSAGTIESLVQVIARDTTSRLRVEDVEDFVRFLYANNLTEQSASGQTKDYVEQQAARQEAWWQWLLHHYLFIKIPLLRPDAWLRTTLPLVAPLYTVAAAWVFIAMACAGLFLVSRQWDTFLSTFLHFFNWRGAVMYGAVLCAVKGVHELGHAYTATRFGCRVATVGVAFMVMMPVLYSDVSDAYRLTDKRKRLAVAAAGVVAELGLAAVATLLWVFLPEGTLRSLAFVVATSSWIMSLSVNLNPLMRFDGYYLLADGLGVPNLQDRAFVFGQWRLREWLFAPGAAPPEAAGAARRNMLIAYAWAVWCYRIVLFTGIAIMVYHYFFKLLGIALFLVEMLFFICLPIWRELVVWWSRRSFYASTRRFAFTMTCLGAVVMLVLIPWEGRISIPAVLQSATYATVYPPAPGRIVSVRTAIGQVVREGDALLVMETPELEKAAKAAGIKVEQLELRIQRQAGNADDRAQASVIREALSAKQAELDGVVERQQDFVLRAPIAGVVAERAESLYPGRWIGTDVPVAYLVDPVQAHLIALVSVEDVRFLTPGQVAQFIPHDLTRGTRQVRVLSIRDLDEQDVAVPYFASIYGGEIPVRKDARGRLQAEQSVYRVEFEVMDHDEPLHQAVTGHAVMMGQPRSLAGRMWDRVAAVMIRESGF